MRRLLAAAGTATLLLLAAACGGSSPTATRQAPTPAASSSAATNSATPEPGAVALRAGERYLRLAMPAAYTPSAPTGHGTDDYRCFLLDPHLHHDAFVTGTDVLPGNPDVVHHVILFRVPPGEVDAAKAKDAEEPGQGWTCFGGTGLDDGVGSLDDAPWLGAWAPGGHESVAARDVGTPVQAGERVIMQVHYNLLKGASPDVTSVRLRIAPGTAHLTPLRTVLLPAPVELPCRPQHALNPLCDRSAALRYLESRVGDMVGQTANALHLLCGYEPAGPVQHCDHRVEQPETIRAVAGHMHLIGRSIRITVNPDGPHPRTVLDQPVWDFDNQGAKPVTPVHLERGDTVRVTCRHDQHLRDLLPAFRGQRERYVVWGEGTTDEMCLGILLVTRS